MDDKGTLACVRLPALFLFFSVMLCSALAGTYELADGSRVSGEISTYSDEGVVIRKADDSFPMLRWSRFSDAGLKQLYDDATTPAEKALLEPIVRDIGTGKVSGPEITVNPVALPPRPTGHLGVLAIFTSPMGWFILIVLYAATIFAAYEVAIFRNQSVPAVCGLAAIPFFGIASPIYYLTLPTIPRALEQEEHPVPDNSAPIPLAHAPPASPPPRHATAAPPPPPRPAPAAAQAPAPLVFSKQEFTFNRRFFETKFPGFFRVVLNEADKEMVLVIKSNRGDFVGRRIPKVTQTELYLQVVKEGASAEEMIPFGEITEVQLLHQSLV